MKMQFTRLLVVLHGSDLAGDHSGPGAGHNFGPANSRSCGRELRLDSEAQIVAKRSDAGGVTRQSQMMRAGGQSRPHQMETTPSPSRRKDSKRP